MTDSFYEKLSEERKKLQAKGDIPPWASTGGWQMFKSKYLYGCNSWREQYERIAKTAASHTEDPDHWEKVFFDLMWKNWLSPSTPILANMGTDRGLPVACSGSYVDDSIQGFYETAAEVAILSKWGFGTSAYLGDIRSRGTPISRGGKADGIFPVIKNLTQVCRDVSQGNSRRGSGAWYIPIEHGDFWEVIGHLESEPDDLNIGWNISDDFINKLNNADPEAIARYQAVLKVRMTLGKGYLFFVDKVNRHRPQAYKNRELYVKASNLCVTGDQLVVTGRGLITARELFETQEPLTLYDNTKIVKASPMRLVAKDEDVYTIELENGMEHTVTGYHKVLTTDGVKECKDLTLEDKVYFQNSKGLFGSEHNPELAFLLGLYQADGTGTEVSISIDLWEPDFDLISEVEESIRKLWENRPDLRAKTGVGFSTIPSFRECSVADSVTGVKVRKKRLSTCILKKLGFAKATVPDWILEGTEETQWQYIRGLFYADGTVNLTAGNGSPFYLSITNTNKQFLKKLQLILANLGVNFGLYFGAAGGEKRLPNGHGGYSLYHCKESYRLVCGNKKDGLVFEKHTGFLNRKGVVLEDRQYRDNTKKAHKIRSITYKGYEDVYCTTVESDEHLWVCNGFVTHNCNEVQLFSDQDHTFTCVLASMNVARYDEWKDTDAVYSATVFLDCVAEEFIQKARGIKWLEKAVAFTEKGRALGLGQMGLFSLFQKRGISPESLEARLLSTSIAKHIDSESGRASSDLARIYGEPIWCTGTGLRNTHRTAIAPTKSTSLIMGGWSEGINPDPAMAFSASGAAGDIDRLNPILLSLIKEKGLDVAKCTSEILSKSGSVQGVEWLTDKEKGVFKTAFEIDQSVIIQMAAARQKFVCQGQSLNLFFAHNDKEDYISRVHQEAFENPDVLGLYYVYSNNEIKADRTGGCEACQ